MGSLKDVLRTQYVGVLDYLKNWRLYNKRLLMVVGPSGSGKSTLVEEACKELGLTLVVVDGSELTTKDGLDRFKPVASLPCLTPCALVVDGFENSNQLDVYRVLVRRRKPVVLLVTEMHKVVEKVLLDSVVVRLPRPRAGDVAKVVGRVKGYAPDYRQAYLMSRYGGEGYRPSLPRMERLVQALRTGVFEYLDDVDKIVLVENLPRVARGWDLLLAYKLLAVADRSRPHAMNGLTLRRARSLDEPVFFEKVRASRGHV